MQERPERNTEIEELEVFSVFNSYFLLLFSMCCIIGSVFLQEIFVILKQFRLGIIVAPALGIIAPVYFLTKRFRRGFREQLRIREPNPQVVFHIFVATLAMVAVVDYLFVFSQRLIPSPVDYLETLKELRPHGLWSAVATFIGLGVVVPVAEEIVFRGLIQRVFERNMGGILALLLAGVFFGVIHLNPQLLLSMVCFGVFLGFVFFATENLTYTILSHSIVNTVAFLQLTFATDENFESAPFYLEHPWMFVLAVGVVVLASRQIKKGARANGTPLDKSDRPL